MENTVLMPVEGKSKFKFKGLTAPQLKILNENRNNIFKALATFGGAYLAYETYKNVIDISEQEWLELLPDELEDLLTPFLQENIDVEESLAESEIIINETQEPDIIPEEKTIPVEKEEEQNEITDNTGKAEEILEEQGIDEELAEEITAEEEHTVIDEEMQEYINSDEFLEDLNDDSATEVVINDDYVDDSENLIFEDDELIADEATEEETSEILEETGIDEALIEDVVIPQEELEIDEEMMAYLNSGDILIDLNEDSAEEIIINNEYIDSDEEIIIDDSDYENLESDNDFFEDDEEWEDDENFDDDIDLNDIPDNI